MSFGGTATRKALCTTCAVEPKQEISPHFAEFLVLGHAWSKVPHHGIGQNLFIVLCNLVSPWARKGMLTGNSDKIALWRKPKRY